MRVAVVSCRNRSESATSDLLKELFHIDSIHRVDYKRECIPSNDTTAEIGCGFLESGKLDKENELVLVLHVVGIFLPVWAFLRKFVDYIIIEDDPDQQCNFYHVIQTITAKQLVDDLSQINDERSHEAAVPYVLLWKPSINNKNFAAILKEQYGFHHVSLECQSGTQICARIRPHLIIALNNFKKSSQLKVDRKRLHDMLI